MTVRYTRVERLAQIEYRLRMGWTHRQIAEDLGVSRSAVRAVLYDPDGSDLRKRHDRQRGVCKKCGAPTAWANATGVAPTQCADCFTQPKVWTADAVIDAIRRFAAEHGRPPTADEWINADGVRNFPARSSVYRSRANSSNPFASWADAIEAAGFPRPRVGRPRKQPERSAA